MVIPPWWVHRQLDPSHHLTITDHQATHVHPGGGGVAQGGAVPRIVTGGGQAMAGNLSDVLPGAHHGLRWFPWRFWMVTPMVGDGWGVPLTLSDKPTLDTFRSSVGIKNAGLSPFFTSKEVAVVDVYANTHHRIVIKGSQNVYRETSNLLTIIGIMCRYHYFDLHPG